MPTPHDYYDRYSPEPHLHNRHNSAPYIEPDWQANLAKDQLPDLSTIGRGPKGDGLYIDNIRQNDTSVSFDIFSDTTGEAIATVGPFPTGNIKVYGDPVHEPVAGETWRFYVDYNVYKDGKVVTKTEEIHVPCGAMGSLIYLYDDVLDRTPDDTYQIDEDALRIYNRQKYPEKPNVRVNDIIILETHKKYPPEEGSKKPTHRYWLTFGTVEAVSKGKVIFTARTFFDYQAVKIYYDSIIDSPFEHTEENPDLWTATGSLDIWDAITDKEYAGLKNAPFIQDEEGNWDTTGPINVSIFENDADYQSGKQVTDSIAAAISTTYRYKGAVDAYEDLPEDAENGWVYHVEQKHKDVPAGTNWAWNADEERWDALGGTIDWNGIATEEYVNAKVKQLEEADRILEAEMEESIKDAKEYSDSNLEKAKEYSDDNLQAAKDYVDEAVDGFSMDYNDLINKPDLATVAISGSYNDLSDKPEIPTQQDIYVATEQETIATIESVLAERGVSR